MPFIERDGLRWYEFRSLQHPSLVHGVFTRRGGISPPPWEGLNVGGTVGDDPDRVRQNRLRVFQSLGRDPHSVFDVWQVHSAHVVLAEEPRRADAYSRADGMVSASPHVTLFMRFADCVPILLFDPQRRAVGLVHAGWKGTLLGVVQEAVRAMQHHFGCDPQGLLAAMGPAICTACYPVGEEVAEMARQRLGSLADQFLIRRDGRDHLDLLGANGRLLERAGVTRIETLEACTAENLGDWYSHRGEGGRTGRFAVLMGLRGD
jgi:hypothetical protein